MIICRSIEDFLEKLKNNNMSELDFDDSNKYKELVEYLTKNLNYDKDGFYAYVLGNCFYYGKGIEQDYEKAVYYYELAANQGFAVAQNNLAICFLKGEGVSQDLSKALEWVNKAIDNGFSYAKTLKDKIEKEILKSIK